MRALLFALALTTASAAPSLALAGQAVRLKANTFDADGVVTLSDLFDGAGAAGRVAVATRTGASVVLNARVVQQVAARAGLDWDNAEGLKTIVVAGGAVQPAGSVAAAAARAGNVDVLTYARNIAAGEIVAPEDLVWGRAAAAPSDSPRDPDAIIGQAARRPLRAGAAALAHDVSAPQIIKAGEIITVSFQADGISLSLQGKALAGGGLGETLNVENTASKKVIQAVVSGPGQAVVGPAADEMKSARSTRFASR
ncbi:flagellar basal body P-ring formation chaperone FlgA [Phenylobacterium soli]|uniref:Flagella basal body P-ring formation protein FlgA n=1 Tax=Phenylobacterium soli TaxID=2170551 RepID=A0A328AIQ2_9CAUL|nr:flagellar basal body P-ring formation chaperone FlgA [Phenylobacterium soli]RAK54660.1 flagella basal body P-ring formation protein FlgA [Phenylobacterium soli]